MLVATVDGVAILRRKTSGDWAVAERTLEGHYISSLMFEPGSGAVFAGVHRGSIHISRDGGLSWEPRGAGITHPHVFSLGFVHSKGKARLYAGTEPAHVFESIDLGESWHELPSFRTVSSIAHWTFPEPPHLAHVKNFSFDPWDPAVIYVCVEQGGLFRSPDGGATWQEFPDIYNDIHRVVIRPTDPNWLYVPGGDGLYRSRDGGRSWDHLTTRTMRIAYPDPLVMHPRFEKLMFMAGAATTPMYFRKRGTADSRIGRSQDGGETWEILTDGFPQHIRGSIEAMALEAWGDGFCLFAGTTDGQVFYSDEGGRRWRAIAEGLPPISKLGHHEMLEEGLSKFQAR